MLEKRFSQKLYNINLTLILLVVFIHAQNVVNRINGFQPEAWNSGIQNFISSGICAIAVPLFFIISGFLFFRDKMAWDDFLIQIRKRFKTVLLPYLIVSFLAILFFFILQSLPFSDKYFNNRLSLGLNSLFKIWLLSPLAYQLWFLRNLIVLVILSPVIYWMIKKASVYAIIFLGICWFLVNDLFLHNIIICVFFFSAGAYIKIYHLHFVNNYKSTLNPWIVAFLWCLTIILSLLFPVQGLTYSLINISIITGIVAIWNLFETESIMKFYDRKIFRLLISVSFFVYLFHEPLLTIVIKLMFSIFKVSDATSIATYFIAPLIVVSICLMVAIFLKKHLPAAYHFVTGNR